MPIFVFCGVAGGPNHKNGHILRTARSLGTSCTAFESWPHSGFNGVLKIPKLRAVLKICPFLCSVELQVASGGPGACGSVCCCKAACLGELCVLDVHMFLRFLGFHLEGLCVLDVHIFYDFGVFIWKAIASWMYTCFLDFGVL